LNAAPKAPPEEKELNVFLKAFRTNRSVFAFLLPMLQKGDHKACDFYFAYEAHLGPKIYQLHTEFTLSLIKYY
jgi:hypothetical protein